MKVKRARHGCWTVWRLLIAARIVRDVQTAWEFCKTGKVVVENNWTIDMRASVPVGCFPLKLKVCGKEFLVTGVGPSDAEWDEFPEVDTIGRDEPPIPGTKLIASCPGGKKVTTRTFGSASKRLSTKFVVK
jgi:hypothetical protein